jgi:hypothetical protein
MPLIRKIQKVFNIAPLAVAKERRDICNECFAKHETVNKCTICGCYLPAKTRLASSSCPIDNWREVDLDRLDQR